MIEAILERCADIDVGKKFVVVCVMKGEAQYEPHTQTKKGPVRKRTIEHGKETSSLRGTPYRIRKGLLDTLGSPQPALWGVDSAAGS